MKFVLMKAIDIDNDTGIPLYLEDAICMKLKNVVSINDIYIKTVVVLILYSLGLSFTLASKPKE